MTSAISRYYLAINLHNYDQKYEEALKVITPLVQQYPNNPIFLLSEGDLYAKLGRKQQALETYHAAVAAAASCDPVWRMKIEFLAGQSIASVTGAGAKR